MDTLRGPFGSFEDDTRDEDYGLEADSDDIGREAPPSPVGQDERRMQVRAYNHWASLLQDRNFPAIDALDAGNLPDFGPHSVLLDFSNGIDNPGVRYLGDAIALECGTDQSIATLDDVPSRSLLSRITDHYMQILANQAPIGFEAEFVNQRGATILYRGILLPFSSDDETIDFIYGVINWKEVADQLTTDELLLEIGQALNEEDDDEDNLRSPARSHDPVTDWADGPALGGGEPVDEAAELFGDEEDDASDDGILSEFALPDLGDLDEEDTIDQSAYASLAPASEIEESDAELSGLSGLSGLRNKPTKKPLDLSGADMPAPVGEDGGVPEEVSFTDEDDSADESDQFEALLGSDDIDAPEDADDWSTPIADQMPSEDPLPAPAFDPEPRVPANDASVDPVPEPDIELDDGDFEEDELAAPGTGSAEGLYDTLAEARELAQVARTREDRSRAALYEAVSRAYDVSLAAAESPEDFAELVKENGLTTQDRAPMTPVVKLVFGANYDKTRLTEYAAVLDHAHRHTIERGGLSDFLAGAEGGLKGMVQAERRLRREEAGKPAEDSDAVRPALAKKLRALDTFSLDALDDDGPEFGVVMIRRTENGDIVLLGEVRDDVKLVEKVARKLVG
ncbi:PAS domain-containing protein [Erythrobacter litoralis]|uniref:Uncharacterized protein n=1 Tax=Erythrobacter litoralis (strain HTCC2594) TaxID=314225 RepID=Q2N6S5_ERYLH|nr:hypothetical protein ELI_12620 [Erythrobacter litoralis HTCC2594]